MNLRKVFEYFWDNQFITNVNIIIGEDGCLNMYTYQIFVDSICREVQIQKIHSSCDDNDINFFPKKIENLHKCPMEIIAFNYIPFANLSRISSKDPWQIDFLEGEIINTFAKYSNATLNAQPFNLTKHKVIADELVNRVVDIMLGGYFLIKERTVNTSVSTPHIYTWFVVFLNNKGTKIPPIQILALPFRKWIWFYLALTCIIGIVSLKIINKIHFLDGFFIMMALVLGEAIRTPNRTSHRLNIAFWLIVSVILTSVYSSKFFSFLQTDLRFPPPNNFLDLLQSSYSKTFICNQYVKDRLSKIGRIKAERMVFKIIDGTIPIEEVLKSKEKVIGVCEEKLYKYGVRSFPGRTYVLPNQFHPFFNTFYFTKNSFLLKRFNEFISRMFSFGVMKHWKAIHYKSPQIKKVRTLVRPLNSYEMRGIFEIILSVSAIAILIFCVEVLIGGSHDFKRYIYTCFNR